MIAPRIYLISSSKLSFKQNSSARSENLTYCLSNSVKKPKQLGFLSCLMYLNVKVCGFVSRLAWGAVFKLKEKALTHPPLQQIMFVFNPHHSENNLVMEKNQHCLLTQQNISTLISDEKLM